MKIFERLREKRFRRRYALKDAQEVRCFVRVPMVAGLKPKYLHEIGVFKISSLLFRSDDRRKMDIQFSSLREFEKHLVTILR